MVRGRLIAFLLSAALWGQAQEFTSAHRDAYQKIQDLRDLGNLIEAREHAAELVASFAEAPPSKHKLAFVNELGNLDQRLGNYAEALAHYENAMRMASTLAGAQSRVVSQLQNNLASLYQILGDFETAEKLNREALATRKQIDGENSVETTPARNNLASLLWCIGDYGAAETLFREALAIRTEFLGLTAVETALTQANLGGLLFFRERVDEAEPLVREAAETMRRVAGETHPDTLEVLLFLAEIERAKGDPAAALNLYLHVHEGRVAALGTGSHPEVAEAMRRVGDALRELGRFQEAIDAYADADRIYLEVLRPTHPDRIEGLYGLGLAAFASGNLDLAREAAETCAGIEFALLDGILAFTDERQRLAYQDIFRSQHLFAMMGDAEAVASFLLRQKGVVLDSLIAESRLMKTSGDPGVAETQFKLSAARARFREAFLSGGGDEGEVAKLEEEVRELRQTLIGKSASIPAAAAPADLSLATLQAGMAEGQILVDYLRYDRYESGNRFDSRYGAVVVTPDRVVFMDCSAAEETDLLVSEMIPFFGAGVPDDNLAESLLGRLYELVWRPLEAGLPPSGSVAVCPEGSLNFVPFACLLDEGKRFLIESHEVRYLSSARDLVRVTRSGGAGEAAFFIGNPSFADEIAGLSFRSDQRGLIATIGSDMISRLAAGLSPLRGAEAEVLQLREIVSGLGLSSSLAIGSEATEEWVQSTAVRPRILHLATHGLYLPAVLPDASGVEPGSSFVPKEVAGFQNPLFGSWLALAGAQSTVTSWAREEIPDPARDGILMANEAAELDLDGTLIVTLSACETASGEATSGDGVIGLRRGFRLAGAENVLSTLWPINDFVTVEIMKDFYAQFGSTPPATALSVTQRDWLRRIREVPGTAAFTAEDGTQVNLDGLYWAIHLAGPFLLGQ